MSDHGGTIRATLSPADAAARTWDALIVGAGPAGTSAALMLTRRGLQALILDKSSFPRWKVCGCCLSAGALHALHALGAGDLPAQLNAVPLHTLDLAAGRARATIPLRGSAAASREALDGALLRAAIDSGCHFLNRTSAAETRVEADDRTVVVRGPDGDPRALHARIVLAADGLAASFAPELGAQFARDSRLGLGATIIVHSRNSGPRALVAPGTISMTVSRSGYVGAVLLEDGRLNIAAALAPAAIRRAESPAHAIADILRSAGRPISEVLLDTHFRGTSRLTRRRTRVAAPRLLALGDSAGYVEPFTGEGIAWSLQSGPAAADMADAILSGRDDESAWQCWWDHHIRPQHGRCAVLTRALRAGPVLRPALAALSLAPRVSAALASLFTSRPDPARA